MSQTALLFLLFFIIIIINVIVIVAGPKLEQSRTAEALQVSLLRRWRSHLWRWGRSRCHDCASRYLCSSCRQHFLAVNFTEHKHSHAYPFAYVLS